MVQQRFSTRFFSVRQLQFLSLAIGLASAQTFAQTTVTPGGPKLGTNLTAVVDYTREWPFLDAFKVARTWIPQGVGLPWGTGLPLVLTADGYPAQLLPGQYAETVMYDNNTDSTASYPTGQYILLYDGEGKIEFDLNSATVVCHCQGRMVVNVPSSQNGIYLAITATNPSNPIHNIRLITPGYEATMAFNPFHPTFLDRLKGYKVLRFMEWMQTNTTTIQNWWERPLVSDYTYTVRGVPLEVMLQLANLTGASPWFNIPHMATNDYVQKFAKTVKELLDPSIPFYIEYSNETWNSIFHSKPLCKGARLSFGS